MADKLNVGLIGVGNISPAYINGCRAFDILNLAACADLDVARAQQIAAEHKIAKASSVDDLLADPNIDIVINLTVPLAHAEVSQKIITAGKHLYSEKPLAVTLDDGRKILAAAQAKNLRVGCAPDTFLFSQHQSARKLLDDGMIGMPVAAVGFMAGRGPERWHPNPDFFYQVGGGPMLDMGPYYVTCLVHLLGPARRVSGMARISFPERVAKDGHRINVQVATHVSGTIEFASGALATLIISFDVAGHSLPQMEIYGEHGTLRIPDPNGFQPREVRLFRPGVGEWELQPEVYDPSWARGIGVADMAYGILYGRPHRASGALAYHALEIMHAFETAARSGQQVELHSSVERPTLLPLGLPARQLDK
ncbi:MAG: Gfo/Idh/MocA family oxidoreductase [Chloroflexi bacterium]|nr:Gfo/Idh/MocA family oxidoreductase [Chloroflexota bacterium]